MIASNVFYRTGAITYQLPNNFHIQNFSSGWVQVYKTNWKWVWDLIRRFLIVVLKKSRRCLRVVLRLSRMFFSCRNGSQRWMEGVCKVPVRSMLLSHLRIVVLLFSAVTEKFKVKKLINLFKCQRFTKCACWHKLRGIKQIKCYILLKYSNIIEYSNILEYSNIFEYFFSNTNIFIFVFRGKLVERIYSYSYSVLKKIFAHLWSKSSYLCKMITLVPAHTFKFQGSHINQLL